MEARDPEQTAMIEITTKVRRVGSVLILKSNFIAEGEQPAISEDELRAKELGGRRRGWKGVQEQSILGVSVIRTRRRAHDLQVIGTSE
jgi:hypothetical protein